MQALFFASQALNVVGTIAGGNQASKIANRNAAAMEASARDTRRATVERENLTRDRSARDVANQRAALLQSGVDPASGTALIGVSQGMQDADMDALTVRYEGLMQAQNMDVQAGMTRYEGKAKKRQAYISAASQLLSAGSGYMNQQQLPAPVESRIPIPKPYGRGDR